MELAASSDVRVLPLPAGADPADEPDGFEERLSDALSYVVYRARLERARATDRQTKYERVKAFLDGVDSPGRHEAWREANDELGMTINSRARSRR